MQEISRSSCCGTSKCQCMAETEFICIRVNAIYVQQLSGVGSNVMMHVIPDSEIVICQNSLIDCLTRSGTVFLVINLQVNSDKTVSVVSCPY